MENEVVVACIAGGFSVVVALLHKLGKENKDDHGRVHQALGRIEQKIDNHTENHP